MPRKRLGAITLPKDKISDEQIERIVRYQFWYSIFGVIIGALAVTIGALLFFVGLVGGSQFTAKLMGAEIEMSDAGPGAILFVIGLLIILLTRFEIKTK